MNYRHRSIFADLSVLQNQTFVDFLPLFRRGKSVLRKEFLRGGEEWHIMRCDGRPIQECREGISAAKG